MTRTSLPTALCALAILAGCASTPPPPPRVAARRAAAAPPPPPPPPSPPPAAPIEVRARPSNPLEFDITASSDLPPPPPSTAQPYERLIDGAVAPLRPALAECLRALGAPARRLVRVTVEEDGSLRPRPPQDFSLPARGAACLDGVLRAATVEPAPPRAVPYDIRVEVAQ